MLRKQLLDHAHRLTHGLFISQAQFVILDGKKDVAAVIRHTGASAGAPDLHTQEQAEVLYDVDESDLAPHDLFLAGLGADLPDEARVQKIVDGARDGRQGQGEPAGNLASGDGAVMVDDFPNGGLVQRFDARQVISAGDMHRTDHSFHTFLLKQTKIVLRLG